MVKVKVDSKVETEIEKAIKDRLLNGFENWNGGYDGWLKWCETLYEPDAHYNLQTREGGLKRLTLQQYEDMMGELFKHFTMTLGDFENMIIRDDWCAIRYTINVKNVHTGEVNTMNTMEFVKFTQNPEPVGVRVVEGWAISDTANWT